jgi:hypothetical protein
MVLNKETGPKDCPCVSQKRQVAPLMYRLFEEWVKTWFPIMHYTRKALPDFSYDLEVVAARAFRRVAS